MTRPAKELLGYAVALFCLLGLAAGWGGFHLLLRAGLPDGLLGAGVR